MVSSLTFAYPIGSLPTHPTVVETLTYQLNGLIVVFLALGMIWGLMEVIGMVFKRRAARAAASKPAQLAIPVVAAAPSVDVPSPQITAVIAASVATVLRGRPHRIQGIALAAEVDWAREGRRQIFASHKVR